jgi:hypothetical protein
MIKRGNGTDSHGIMNTQRFMTIQLTHKECKGGQTATRQGCKYSLFPYEGKLVYNEHNDHRYRTAYWCLSSCISCTAQLQT